MRVAEALTTLLEGAGTTAGTRVYPVLLPQAPAYPAITYARIAGAPVQHSGGAAGLVEAQFQVDCWGATDAAARALAVEVKATLDAAANGIRCHFDNEQDVFEKEPRDGVHRVVLDITIWFEES